LIFNLYNPVAVKIGSERYVFDRKTLMFTEVVTIERASGLSFAEWEYELGRGSLMAAAALLHALRKRENVPSDYETMNFAAFDLEVVPLHPDGSEFTAEEVAADVQRRLRERDGNGKPDPTAAAGDSAAGHQDPEQASTASTSPSSPKSSESGPGSGRSSAPKTSKRAKST
jgi:hypothetical protein